MRNLKLFLAMFISLCICSSVSYGQSIKDRVNKPVHVPNKGKVITTGGTKARPSVITSLVSNAEGLQLKFTTSDKALTRISIYRKDMEEGNFVLVKSIKPNRRTHTYTDSGRNLKQGHQYCYQIKTWLKGQGIGTPSKGEPKCQFFDGEFNLGARPKNPMELKVLDVTSNSVTVTFKDRSSNEEYFFLERKEPHHSEWKVTAVKDRPNNDSEARMQVNLKNTALEMEQRYHYRVRAVNTNGGTLSNTIGVKTYPVDIGNGNVEITHPSKNILQVAWKYDKNDKPDWLVDLYNIEDVQNPLKTKQVNKNQKRMTSFSNLDPAKQYCFGIRVKGSSVGDFKKVCDSPFAKRTLENHTGPIVPAIRLIDRVSNNELKINLRNGVQGQLIDIVKMDEGQRETSRVHRNGSKTLRVVGLNEGKNYCMRMLTTNEYGTRYSPRKCQATILNPPKKPYVTNISTEHIITVEWTSNGADEHTFEYSGSKSGTTDHEGSIKLDIPYDYKEFQAKPNYSYCFKVKSKNAYDVTDWSPSLCGVISEEEVEAEEVISFASSLDADIPPSGNVIYLGQVAPGNNSRLLKVHVAGNSFTPYIVQFLPPGKTRDDCGSNEGVFIEPGNDLEGDDLDALYGNSEPKTPVFFGACKLARPNKTINTSRIPIQIDYVKE